MIGLELFASHTICDSGLLFGIPTWSDGLNFDAQCNVVGFGLSDIWKIVANLTRMALGLAALLAIIFIIVGGIQFILSRGNPESTKKAQDIITNAILGLIVAILASSIVGFIASKI